MILKKIRIQNFKSIIDSGDIYLSESDLITILAGQNESGKTAFLRALRFFEEGSYDGFEEEDKRRGASPKVECTFSLKEEEYDQLKEDTSEDIAKHFQRNGVTVIRQKIKGVNRTLTEIFNDYNGLLQAEDSNEDNYYRLYYNFPNKLKGFSNEYNEGSSHDNLLNKLKRFSNEDNDYSSHNNFPNQLTGLSNEDNESSSHDDLLNKLKGFSNEDNEGSSHDNLLNKLKRFSNEDNNYSSHNNFPNQLTGLSNAFSNTYNKSSQVNELIGHYFSKIRPRFVFYSSFTKSLLPSKIMYRDIDGNQAVQDFQSVYEVNFKQLLSTGTHDIDRIKEKERINKEATDSLNNYWNQTISGEEVKYTFNIEISHSTTNKNEGYVNFLINQGDDQYLSISQKSQGFQWFSGFNLRLRAHQKKLDKQEIILLIDEPGQGLHEQAQDDVRNVLEELARGESKIQIIYSTHQPILLGKKDINFPRLLLADRNTTDGSKFKTISQYTSSSGSSNALAPIKSALGLISISSIPSDKKTLVTEGVTEYYYLKTLFKDDFTIIPSVGADQIPNIFAILYGWGINAKAMIDDDDTGEKVFNKIKRKFFTDENLEEFEKTILKIPKSKGIESLLSENTITTILQLAGKEYDTAKSKIENIEQVGKMIFAKLFFDKYSDNNDTLCEETKSNFQKIKDFMGD